MQTAKLIWNQNMSFTAASRNVHIPMDATVEHGGIGEAPTPKELVLYAMMGCTAMDVVSMLKKMRQEISEFKMEITAEKTLEHPIHFKKATLFFFLKGSLEDEKVLKALHASLTKYCGVNYMISKSCDIFYHLQVNDRLIDEGKVKFIEPQKEE